MQSEQNPEGEGPAPQTAPTAARRKPANRIRGNGRVDVMGIYLDEAAKHSLLSVEEEKRLGTIVQEGLRAEEALSSKERLPASDRQELFRKVDEGKRAQEAFIVANLRLVVSIAKRFQRNGRYDLAELVQYGNFGLMHAVKKFDPQKGFKFSTYATWWIRQAVTRSLPSEGLVFIPSRVTEEQSLIVHTMDDMRISLGRQPTHEEIADAIGTSGERVAEVLSFDPRPLSFSQPIVGNGEGMGELGDVVTTEEDQHAADVETHVSMTRAIDGMFSLLSEQERRIFCSVHGIGTGTPRSRSDVAKDEGITNEELRNILNRAKSRLRHPSSGMRSVAKKILGG